MRLFEFDQSFLDKSVQIIAGTDEAGRGSLAGPVVSSIVIFPQNLSDSLKDLNDSKKLSHQKRKKLYKIILKEALAVSTSFISESQVDELNILNATKLAMQTCLKDIFYTCTPDLLLIDGNFLIDTQILQKNIVAGDSKSASIAAASIVAEVERDMFMDKMHEKYPEYGFNSNKGYGSKAHVEAIKKYGPCKIHRKSFSPVFDFFSNQMELKL